MEKNKTELIHENDILICLPIRIRRMETSRVEWGGEVVSQV